MSMDLHPTPFPGKFQPVKSRFNKNISKAPKFQPKESSIPGKKKSTGQKDNIGKDTVGKDSVKMTNAATTSGATSSRSGVAPTIPPAEKPAKFTGVDFKRWQQKMFFYLTTLILQRFISENLPVMSEKTPDDERFLVTES